MKDATVLLITVFLPLCGAILVGVPGFRRRAREVALLVAIVTAILAGIVVWNFPLTGLSGGDFAVTDIAWLSHEDGASVDVRFSIGLDGLGVWMFGLTGLLVVTSVLVSWEAIKDRAPLFYGMLLLLEFGCLGVFVARDIVLFYVFFEFTLIPLFFLIGIWGSEERRYAAIKFFLFTLAGSVLTLLGLLTIVMWDYFHAGQSVLRFSIPELTASLQQQPIDPLALQISVFLALFAGFAIKVPLFPLHTWLPLAHVQAPTAGSVLLAGVLLKIGTYGFVRFSLPMLPDASAAAMPWVMILSVVGIVYGALVALAQSDMKRLIAYSSVSHLGFCMLGLFAFNPLGLQGGTLQMVNHGLSTGALFALIGMLYERYHTREISQMGGLARRMPWFAFFFLLFTFSSIGLPGLNGFVGEFMILLGAFQRAWTGSPESWQFALRAVAVLAVSGVVLGAWYMLWLVQRIIFGPLQVPHHEGDHAVVRDLSLREILSLSPLAVFVLWIGIQPNVFLQPMQSTLNPIAATVNASLREQMSANEDVARTDEIGGERLVDGR